MGTKGESVDTGDRTYVGKGFPIYASTAERHRVGRQSLADATKPYKMAWTPASDRLPEA
jgi:hypothetical protein